jgi:hypothetical protein
MIGRLSSCALTLAVGGAYAATAFASDCNELLRLGVRNTFYYQNAVDAQSVLADRVCNAWTQSRSSGGSGKVGVDVFGVVGISLGGQGNVTEQQADTYCSTHQADRRLSTQELTDLNVLSAEALQAWNHCLDNAKHDLNVDVSDVPSTGTVTIALRYQGSGTIRVKGVSLSSPISPPPVSCIHQVKGALNRIHVDPVGPTTNFLLNSGTTETIICNHEVSVLSTPPTNPRNATVTISTDLDPVVVPLYDPQFVAVPRSEITTLVQAISDLKKQVDALEASMIREQNASTFVLANQCPNGWARVAQIGFLMKTNEYQNNPFSPGSVFNAPEWTWTHPILCKAQQP